MSEQITIIAVWRTRAGEEEKLAALLAEYLPIVRQEPGCLEFTAQRGADDPRLFAHYERYRDHAAFLAHRDNPQYKDYVLGRCVPLLEERKVYVLHELAV
ncbi:MAG: antibiotic biosynthesis monooxygenase [Verrucomicrobia bacterium]|nr:antibiotic biosynthesis monooxygenase [Verrucomicrobiota bacterium]